MKESRRYNVSVSINHDQDLEKMLSSVVRTPMAVKWNTKQGRRLYREKGGTNRLINKSAFT